MARSPCNGPGLGPGQGPGPGTMGYCKLCQTVHTALELGQGQGPGNLSMGFQPIFQDLKYFPVVLCNRFQLHA